MLVGAAVAAIERERLLKVLHRRPPLTQAVMGIADIILNVGVARVAQSRELEGADRGLPVGGRERLLAGGEIGIERPPAASVPPQTPPHQRLCGRLRSARTQVRVALERLKAIPYPGFTRDIVSFGLIQDIEVASSGVTVKLAPTTAQDDVVDSIEAAVRAAVGALPGVGSVEIAEYNSAVRSRSSGCGAAGSAISSRSSGSATSVGRRAVRRSPAT